MAPTIGFFTRILDDVDAAARYRIALDQISLAERLGYRTAWVAQHHLDGDEGGLPSPFVLLAAAAARTSRIRLGTAILGDPRNDENLIVSQLHLALIQFHNKVVQHVRGGEFAAPPLLGLREAVGAGDGERSGPVGPAPRLGDHGAPGAGLGVARRRRRAVRAAPRHVT